MSTKIGSAGALAKIKEGFVEEVIMTWASRVI